MEEERRKNLVALFDNEFKASTSAETRDESESLSDIDDEEVKELNTVAEERGTNVVVLSDNEFKASTSGETQDESESFSDIDDEEIDGYIFNEQEMYYRRIFWESVYQDAYEELVAEGAVAAAENEVSILSNRLEALALLLARHR